MMEKVRVLMHSLIHDSHLSREAHVPHNRDNKVPVDTVKYLVQVNLHTTINGSYFLFEISYQFMC